MKILTSLIATIFFSISLNALANESTDSMSSSTAQYGKTPLVSEMLSHMDLFWTGNLNGQALNRPLGENYNVFARGPSPIYIYHTLDWDYRLDHGSKNVGFELSAKQDLVHGIQDDFGFPLDPQFTVNDPQFWYKQYGVFETSWLKVDAQLSVFPGLTEYSRNSQGLLFSSALDGTWNLKLLDYHWTAYLTSRVRPSFYRKTQPDSMWDQHDRLYFSVGHFLSYHLSPSFELTTSSVLDMGYSADHIGLMRRGDANDDRAQLGLNYYTPHGFARVGAYFLGLIANPRLQTSVVGLDLTINFLTAKSM